VKQVELSGTNRGNIRKKITSLKQDKNIRDLCRGISEFKKVYQLRTNLVKGENDDLLVDYHNILSRCKNYLCQLLKLRGVNGVRLKWI
jgi:hypothetical protein